MEYKDWSKEIAEATYLMIWKKLRECDDIQEEHLREVTGSYLEHAGKALRPALLSMGFMAFSGESKTIELPACAAVEMFHTWSLMHDDVIDHDDFRRGRPTAHKRGESLAVNALGLKEKAAAEYGVAVAILGGDMLHSLAVDMLLNLEVSPELSRSLASRMANKLTAQLLSGEQLDIRLSQTPWNRIATENVMQMMELKTGALLQFCIQCGMALGQNAAVEECRSSEEMGRFANLCGVAFQLKDDWLGIFGEQKAFGKPVGSDIREGKRTFMMLKTLEGADDAERRELLSILGRSDASEDDFDVVRGIIRKTGAEDANEKMVDECISQAYSLLTANIVEPTAKSFLESWLNALVKRSV